MATEKKIVTIVGARPQFIKAGALSRVLNRESGIEEVLVHTGQHYDNNMSDIFFQELQIPAPRYHLGIGSGLHGAQTGKMLEGIEGILLAEKPDAVVVYGDTNSTLAGAIAAVKLHIPVVHVEAGLRSFNRKMPEEMNRILTDHASALLLAPTETAVAHLRDEGIPAERVHNVGDVMYDVSLFYSRMSADRASILGSLKLEKKNYLLTTIHRAENTDQNERMRAILEALVRVSRTLPVVLPLHPRTQKVIQGNPELAALAKPLKVIDPVGYLDMVTLESNAKLITTDSGGVQKEAFFYRVPCVTLRDETEWVELVGLGWNHLAPPLSADKVEETLQAVLKGKPGVEAQPYGDGHAAEKIRDLLKNAPLKL
ncbi:MAG: UDP-N-acetylglucosamine 2-epimerase (non-hydrolyzing) [Planctomycetales bacterium]